MPRKSLLERIVEEGIQRTSVGTVSVATEKWAEELAREFMADAEFRKSFRDSVRRFSDEFFRNAVSTGGGAKRRRSSRSKTKRQR